MTHADADVTEQRVEVAAPRYASVREVDIDAQSDRRGRALVARRWVVRLVAFTGFIGATATFLLTPVNGNIRYELGVKFASVFSPSETFSHRPLAFRLLLDSMSRVAEPLSFGLSSFEVLLRLIGLGLAVTAGILLWLGLRNYDVVAPGLHTVVAVAALVFMGTSFSLEPDWMAVVLTIAGTGVALLGRRRLAWPMAVLSSTFFVAAAGMKIITVLPALIGLLVVAVLDRRQVARTMATSAVVGVLYIIATAVWVPWEITWLVDIRLLTPSVTERLVSHGPRFLLESAVRWPAVLMFPAALILAGRLERLLLVAALLLSVGPIVFQAQYFGYHGAALCVVSAIAALRALRHRVTPPVGVTVAAVVLAASLMTTASGAWRVDHRAVMVVVTVGVTLLGIGWALGVRGRQVPERPAGLLVAACATLALLYPAMTPFASLMVRMSPSGVLVATPLNGLSEREIAARQIRARIGGPDVPVTYLTFGDWTYFIRNPTVCRYPSPLFLQRTRYTLTHVGSPSYEENLACLSEPTSRWLIMDEKWFPISRTPPEVQARIHAEWNCGDGFESGGLKVCPRR